MNSEFYLVFEVYLENGFVQWTLETRGELFYKFITDLKAKPGVNVELNTILEDTVENDGVKYAKIRNSYVVKDIMGSDYEIAYRFSYTRIDEDEGFGL